MLKYKAAARFRDRFTGRLYEAGDEFCTDGLTGERIEELAGDGNVTGAPLIAAYEVPENPVAPVKAARKTGARKK